MHIRCLFNFFQQLKSMEEVGTIISTFDSPTTDRFKFIIRGPIRKDQFVEFDTEEGKAIARVSEITKTNRYFMQAESVNEYEKSGLTMENLFPTQDWEYLVGDGIILGIYDNKIQRRSCFPPSPGTKIYMAEPQRLSKFLGLDPAYGLNIGTLQHHKLEAVLNLTKTLQKHIAILAKSGAGKSYLASVLLEELLDREPEKGQIAIIAIDPHGEYSGFAKDEKYMNKILVYSARDIKLSAMELSAQEFEHIFPDLKPAQKRELGRILNELKHNSKENSGPFGLKDIENKLMDSNINTKTKEILLDKLDRLQRLYLFGKYDNPSLEKIEAGKMIVLDLSNTTDQTKKQIIVDQFMKRLFRARQKNKIPPFFVLVEEAHNFAPEGINRASAISRGIIIKIAREGRKFGACLGLISQRPAGLSTTALSQCNTHIFLRVTNPYDLKHIEESSEGITADVRKSIPGLRVGDCIVVGEAVTNPIFVSVRKRRSKEFETGRNLEQVAKDYAQKKANLNKDTEAFI